MGCPIIKWMIGSHFTKRRIDMVLFFILFICYIKLTNVVNATQTINNEYYKIVMISLYIIKEIINILLKFIEII